jgi:hypothetical protein
MFFDGDSTDWKSHFLVEYSKNKFACEVMDEQIQDDWYRVIDDVKFITRIDSTWCQIQGSRRRSSPQFMIHL